MTKSLKARESVFFRFFKSFRVFEAAVSDRASPNSKANAFGGPNSQISGELITFTLVKRSLVGYPSWLIHCEIDFTWTN